MSKKTKSARGDIVDFDLLKIKQQIAASPSTSIVHEREMQIDRKLKRKVKKVAAPAPKVKQTPPVIDAPVEEKAIKKQKARIPDNNHTTIEDNAQETDHASETDQQ